MEKNIDVDTDKDLARIKELEKEAVKINNWAIKMWGGPLPKRRIVTALVGEDEKGNRIKPAEILGGGLRIVITKNKVYSLGKINKRYRESLKIHWPDWDWRNPIAPRW